MNNHLKKIVLVGALVVVANVARAENVILDSGLFFSSEIEVYGGYIKYTDETGEVEWDERDYEFLFGGTTRVSLPFGENISFQLDGDFEVSEPALSNGFGTEPEDDLFTYSLQGVAHLSYRDPKSFLIGGFAASGRGQHDDDDDGNDLFNFYTLGAEVQFYLDDLTFYVQSGYIDGPKRVDDPDVDDDSLRDAFFGRGVVRWFPTPNSRLQAEISYVDGTIDNDETGSPMTITEWGLRYDFAGSERRAFGNKTLFAAYRGGKYTKVGGEFGPVENGSFLDHFVMVGINYDFGSRTIKEKDRFGATLDLPNVARWVSMGEPLE